MKNTRTTRCSLANMRGGEKREGNHPQKRGKLTTEKGPINKQGGGNDASINESDMANKTGAKKTARIH